VRAVTLPAPRKDTRMLWGRNLMSGFMVRAGAGGFPTEVSPVAPTGLARGAMTGVSVLALSLGLAAATAGSAAAQPLARTIIDGNDGGGVILLGGAAAGEL